MKSSITRFAVAAAIIVAVLVGINQFSGNIDLASAAFADVLENVRNSKTLTFLIRAKELEPPIMKVMVVDAHLLRFEFLSEQMPDVPILNGKIWIVDTNKSKALILNTVKKTGKIYPADKEMLDVYNTFRNFRERVEFSVDEIGSRQIGDRQAIGFKLNKANEHRQIIVWADAETKLPILMEETYENAKGQAMRHIITDIVFDAELDGSLFSLKPPQGYKLEKFDYDPAVKRLMSAAKMDRILKACREYVNEHGGQWPDSLHELESYGLDEEIFTNPRQPKREVGYIYLKPPISESESRIVLFEAYDVWNGGINVGFANYHVQFIKQESDLKNQLEKSIQHK
ncbi:MAG: hypothetical protein JSW59_03820 [Phycisphaerales bacterium]|nr:MAG: hypothetical protein JSW59_03820 [Phycisphaerales bacterium]